VVYFLGQPAG